MTSTDMETALQKQAETCAVQEIQLTATDQSWMASFGVDPCWQDDVGLRQELAALIEQGSRRLDEPVNQVDYSPIVEARTQFMSFVNIPETTLATFQSISPTIVPLDTFIATQRVMCSLGLDAAKVINTLPAAIGYDPESVRAKVENLTALGLDAAKVINTLPAAISLAPESVRAKVENLTALGLDAAKVINTLPPAISLAPESVRAKVENLTALGLDAAKVINTLPPAISYAPESVRAKMKLLERSAAILRWEYSAQDLVQTYPALLGFNTKKLKVLVRIAAYHIDVSSRSADPKAVRSALFVPLEKYIIQLSDQEQATAPHTIQDLSKEATRRKLTAEQRKEQALEVAPKLGKVGIKYLNYRNQ